MMKEMENVGSRPADLKKIGKAEGRNTYGSRTV
jgi:hypothetical protein